MKKVKVILTAVSVFAIVGGALAFKANTLLKKNVYCRISTGCSAVQPFQTDNNFEQPVTNPCGATITTFFTTNQDACTTLTKNTDDIPVYPTTDN